MIMAEWLWNLAAVILVVLVWSAAFRDTPLFRFAEYTIVGASAGYFTVVAIQSIRTVAVTPILSTGQVWLALAIVMGLLLFTRSSKWPWIYRYPMALVVGTGTGLALRSGLQAQFISQIQSTILPIRGPPMTVLSNLVTMIMVIFIVSYFIFTAPQKGAPGRIFTLANKIARYMLMATFGAAFVSFFLTAYTFMIDRVDFVIKFLRGS